MRCHSLNDSSDFQNSKNLHDIVSTTPTKFLVKCADEIFRVFTLLEALIIRQEQFSAENLCRALYFCHCSHHLIVQMLYFKAMQQGAIQF